MKLKESGLESGLEKTKADWSFSGSYTIEMAYIMTVFCMVMVVLVQQAYRLHDETKSGMKLQEAIEQMRHDEDGKTEEIEKKVQQNFGLMFSMEGTNIKLNSKKKYVQGSCTGKQKGKAWSLEISSRVYEPEEFLRMMAALKQLEERDEHQLQKGDAP